MLTVAFETATGQVGVALADAHRIIADVRVAEKRRHVEALIPAVKFMLTASGRSLTDVKVVAVDIGPGLFTGLRVGLVAAKTFAWAQGARLVGISSLEALAYAARGVGDLVMPVIDGRRGEVFTAAYRVAEGALVEVLAPRVETSAELIERLPGLGEPVALVGDGARLYAERLQGVPGVSLFVEDHLYPSPAAVARLGVLGALRGEFADPATLEPLYLREPHIHPHWRTRQPQS